ncbi:CRISPR-associated ring nuclease Csm6 [Zoogloea sp.]|uniref:CRISPR-associated ring nuclease Csm6 n=1 Tax=Zoogloea sp. TaxID=49181 RepID=UPI001E0B0733|nr:CRISPR-associated ring nuclease Csm6 [Zoogloea sp.]MBK6653982.1 TIGR02584 family CRISPR-associated protein [Zoogloea sp.]
MASTPSPKRILLAVTGLTPQIVTETLYALACRDADPWVPHEIHLITTTTGAESARLNLLHGNGWFHRLCRDYDLPRIVFPAENIHVLRDAAGAPLDDIRTQAQNTLAADFIMDKVRELTQEPSHELHVSIAGGRKTMGYYLGYALSLYGRPQDRLSHVLVSDPYETNRDFYYPTPYDHPIHGSRGNKDVTVDARNARVELADIPFVRLREGLPERLREGHASFSQVVGAANRSLDEPRLVLNVAQRQVWADEVEIKLSETEFLLLLWLAQRSQREEADTDWSSDTMVDEFLDLARQVLNEMSSAYERIESALLQNRSIAIKTAKYFEPHKSRIKKAFVAILGEQAAKRYLIVRQRGEDTALYFLPLGAEQIEILANR